MTNAMKWITGGMEAVLGLPIIGASIIVGNLWAPLALMAVLHIVTLLLALKSGRSIIGSVLGIVTSIVGVIPFVGMTMHIVTAFVLIIDAFRGK
jgi:hypothetical protein